MLYCVSTSMVRNVCMEERETACKAAMHAMKRGMCSQLEVVHISMSASLLNTSVESNVVIIFA